MAEFDVNGNRYKSANMNTLTAWNMARKLGPVAMSLIEVAGILTGAGDDTDATKAAVVQALPHMMTALADMPDEHSDFVVSVCMATVQRLDAQTGQWAKVQASPGVFMFEDIDVGAMALIVFNVIRENLAGFLPVAK